MVINENKRKTKRQERKAEKAKKTKLEKYYDTSIKLFYSFITLVVIVILITIFFSYITENVELINRKQIDFVFIIGITSCMATIVSIILLAIFVYKWFKEDKKESERENKRKESLIAQLNKTEFKEIKLKKTKNRFFNAFLNSTIKAKVHPDNDEIIIVEFCFVDDFDQVNRKSVPFSKDYLFENIEDVIDVYT